MESSFICCLIHVLEKHAERASDTLQRQNVSVSMESTGDNLESQETLSLILIRLTRETLTQRVEYSVAEGKAKSSFTLCRFMLLKNINSNQTEEYRVL